MDTVSLEKHFETIIKALDRRLEDATRNAQLAVDKAEQAQNKRLDLLNEFKELAAEKDKTFALKDITERGLNRLENQISRLYGGLAVVGIIGVANLVKFWMH